MSKQMFCESCGHRTSVEDNVAIVFCRYCCEEMEEEDGRRKD